MPEALFNNVLFNQALFNDSGADVYPPVNDGVFILRLGWQQSNYTVQLEIDEDYLLNLGWQKSEYEIGERN